jgi:CysZ protein
MIAALGLAVAEIFEPRLRRALLLGLLIAAAVLAALVFALATLLHHAAFAETWFLGRAVELLGDAALLVLAWLLFPVVVTTVVSFFLEGALVAVEARRYPLNPPPRRVSLARQARSGLRLALLGIAVNLVALPLYLLLPGIGLVLFYGLNGWLMGREYFEIVALRRFDERQLARLWRAHRPRLIIAGIVIAVLLTLPFVNLAAPLIAALFMLHLFERLRSNALAMD